MKHLARPLLAVCLAWLGIATAPALAQKRASDKVVNYETISDEPYSLHKLFLHIQLINADVWRTNFALCYGTQFEYLVNDRLVAQGIFRNALGRRFDTNRWLAEQNAGVMVGDERWDVINAFVNHTYLEAGATYYFRDTEKKGVAKVMLTKKKSKKQPYGLVDRMTVNARVRQMFGARAGGVFYDATGRLGPVLDEQNQTLTATSNGETYTLNWSNEDRVYTNVSSPGFYVGGAFAIVKNVAVKAERFGNVGNNIMFSTFADLIVAPWTQVEDVLVRRPDSPEVLTFSTEPLQVRRLGWRAGFDVKYNQNNYFSFGGEVGMRPSVAGRGFYTAVRLGFPVFAFKFKQMRTANNTDNMK